MPKAKCSSIQFKGHDCGMSHRGVRLMLRDRALGPELHPSSALPEPTARGLAPTLGKWAGGCATDQARQDKGGRAVTQHGSSTEAGEDS